MGDEHPDSGADRIVLVLSTLPDAAAALRVARSLVEQRLIACGSVLPGVVSVYRWEGEVQEAGEAMLLMKTSPERLDSLFLRLGELHPYAVPEVVGIPAGRVSETYQRWVRDETRGP
ncbi:MAG: divalent-cation tolerance protein CutA [Gemmatimonadota bacterium]|jgi:periplasmic divalent cation tolerance protein|nr:divalent-cation tolerance protein CutA [Gemmatimonadota bacterium]